jgi:alpha-1,2-mannosyltransferase
MRTAARVLAVVALAAAVWFYAFHLSPLFPWHREFDLKVYRGAVQWWLDHRPLYTFHRNRTVYGFTYPPFAALTMLPLALVGQTTAMTLQVVANGLLVVAFTWWLVRPVADRHGWPRVFSVALAVPLVYALEPVRETIGYGQVNLYLAALVVLDVVGVRRGWRWAGVGTGIATAVKLTPGLFILYFLLTGRRRTAGIALGTFAGATLLAALVAPSTSRQFWTSTLFDTSRVGRIESGANQSVLGLIARLGGTDRSGTGTWLLAAAAVVAFGMWRAVRAFRAGDEVAGVTLTGLTACLASPISWTHHLVWVVPAIVVLVDVGAGTPLSRGTWPWPPGRRTGTQAAAGVAAVAVYAVFFLSVVSFVSDYAGYPTATGPVAALAGNAYALAMLALLALLPARRLTPVAPSAARTTAPPPPAGSSPR